MNAPDIKTAGIFTLISHWIRWRRIEYLRWRSLMLYEAHLRTRRRIRELGGDE